MISRLFIFGALASGMPAESPANAQSTPAAPERAYRLAYDASIKCFVANGRATGMRSRAGDAVGAAAYEAKARRAHAVAINAGTQLGYSPAQIERQFFVAQENELPRMIRDSAYFTQAVADCRALNLM